MFQIVWPEKSAVRRKREIPVGPLLRVLIVDDSMLARAAMRRAVERLRYEVVAEAENGVEAIGYYCMTRPDVVAMDVMMPKLDGIDATEAILDVDISANIVLVTTKAEREIVLRARERDAKGYILKPYTSERLAATFLAAVAAVTVEDEN